VGSWGGGGGGETEERRDGEGNRVDQSVSIGKEAMQWLVFRQLTAGGLTIVSYLERARRLAFVLDTDGAAVSRGMGCHCDGSFTVVFLTVGVAAPCCLEVVTVSREEREVMVRWTGLEVRNRTTFSIGFRLYRIIVRSSR